MIFLIRRKPYMDANRNIYLTALFSPQDQSHRNDFMAMISSTGKTSVPEKKAVFPARGGGRQKERGRKRGMVIKGNRGGKKGARSGVAACLAFLAVFLICASHDSLMAIARELAVSPTNWLTRRINSRRAASATLTACVDRT